MKTITLMRHAESISSTGVDDFDRTLTEQGRVQAKKAVKFIVKYKVEKIIVSPAKRTFETMSIILQDASNIIISETIHSLYQISLEELIELIKVEDNNITHLMIIGHAPTLLDAILNLILPDSKEFHDILDSGLPCASLVVINYPELNHWNDLVLRQGVVEYIFNP